MFMLVKRGCCQRMQVSVRGRPVKAWPVFDSLKAAQRFIEYYGFEGVTVAEIGSVQGETLAGHVRMAVEDGCEIAINPRMWTEDGRPLFGYRPLV